MSLNFDGFDEAVQAGEVLVRVSKKHPLIKLANKLPWLMLLQIILPDLKRTRKLFWWLGRPLKIRIHLGVYLLQQLFNLTDRQTQYQLENDAGFRLFCGYGIVKKWHAPHHTKIEEFRSRLSPETQRQLANYLTVHATKLKFANPAHLDIDSTIQEANISYPSSANLLVKVAGLAKRLVKPLNSLKSDGTCTTYQVSLKHLKAQLLYYFDLKRHAKFELSREVLKSLWQAVAAEVFPILKDTYKLLGLCAKPKHWNLRRAVEQLQWNGYRFLEILYTELFENMRDPARMYALHAYEVACFNKNKLNKKKQYGRSYQLGRVEGNFAIVGECTSLHMPDAQSLPAMVEGHGQLFGKGRLVSVSVDKGYYAASNQQFLEAQGVQEIGLPRPRRTLNVRRNPTPAAIQEQLYNRRAGIEAIIGHIKHGGQLGRSRMKSDRTTLAAGYASVLGFNLRQLKRYLTGEVRPKNSNNPQNLPKMDKISANDLENPT